MKPKILVADDSLTIQKVINITLSGHDYEIVECLNEDDLNLKISDSHFDLVLLDFNLSDSKSGYQLSKKIAEAQEGTPIMVMLGTFDSVDELLFEENGITDKIVKPFESNKFIKKCKDLIEDQTPRVQLKSKVEVDEAVELEALSDSADMWKVDAPSVGIDLNPEIEEKPREHSLDPLSSEMEGWGFKTSSILEEKYQKSFPPVIEEAREANIVESLKTNAEMVANVFEDTEATDPSFEIPEDLNRNLLNEIDDEVSAEAFWAVDEVVPLKSEEQEYIVDTNLDEVTADLTETVQAFKSMQEEEESKENYNIDVESSTNKIENSSIDEEQLVLKIKNSLRPMIEELVKEYCKETATRIAWEVIPDLAENLIRKEIKEISDSVH